MVTLALKGVREMVGKKCRGAGRVGGSSCEVRALNRKEDRELKKTEKPIDATPASDTAVFACGFIPVCLYIRFWESFFGLSSVFVRHKEEGEGSLHGTSFPSDWNQIDWPYQFTLQEEVPGLHGDNTISGSCEFTKTALRRL